MEREEKPNVVRVGRGRVGWALLSRVPTDCCHSTDSPRVLQIISPRYLSVRFGLLKAADFTLRSLVHLYQWFWGTCRLRHQGTKLSHVFYLYSYCLAEDPDPVLILHIFHAWPTLLSWRWQQKIPPERLWRFLATVLVHEFPALFSMSLKELLRTIYVAVIDVHRPVNGNRLTRSVWGILRHWIFRYSFSNVIVIFEKITQRYLSSCVFSLSIIWRPPAVAQHLASSGKLMPITVAVRS